MEKKEDYQIQDTPREYLSKRIISRIQNYTILQYGYFRKKLHSILHSLKYSILIPMRRRLGTRDLRQKLIIYALLSTIFLVVVGFLAAFGLFVWYGRDLPSPGKLSQASNNSTIFYDRGDKILYELYKDKNRVPVPIREISKYLQLGTVAVEDKTFYKHKGISEQGILRAFVMSALGRGQQGGSTITQQLIKNVLLDSQRAWSRKIKEAILAVEAGKLPQEHNLDFLRGRGAYRIS